MKVKRSLSALIFMLVFFHYSVAPVPVYAANGYIKETSGMTREIDDWLYSNTGQPPSPFKYVKVWWKLLEGDSIGIRWRTNNSEESQVGYTPVGTEGKLEGSAIIYPPGNNCYSSQLEMFTGVADGVRFFGYEIVENMQGKITSFPKPNTSDYVPPPKPEATNRDIVEAIENQTDELGGKLDDIGGNLESQLGNISSGLNNVSNGINQVNSKLDGVNSRLDDIKGQLSTISGQLSTISNQLTAMQNTLNSIDNNLRQLKDYIMTPRQADPIHTNGLNPVPYFDPTPPPIDDPAPAPYVYDKPIPEMPGFIDSPGPLPRNPDPMAMEHDDPLSKDEPVNLEEPYESDDPYTKDSSLSPEEPLQRQDPNMDIPLPVDPFNMDTPLPIDGFNPEQPITREEPLAPSGGYTPEAPLLPEAPITPQNPVGP